MAKKEWDESKHPRHPAGSSQGGEFKPGDLVYRPGVPQAGVLLVIGKETGRDNKGRAVSGVRVTAPDGMKMDFFKGKKVPDTRGTWFATAEVRRKK